jgi:hypothetical protein
MNKFLQDTANKEVQITRTPLLSSAAQHPKPERGLTTCCRIKKRNSNLPRN